MFSKILIANRGEISCRVIATARRLGIKTVAVYSEADAGARHVTMADEAWPIGPAAARESYLVGERILEVAVASGAEAIHPGYGFLSENAGFAAACEAAGVVFIGPPAEAIRAMGSKADSKSLMERSGVPLVPGYHGEAQDIETLRRAASSIGYPVLIKASAGGGGKGMRIVETERDIETSIESAKRESMAAFGDHRLLIEKYLTRPRHIEIQIFADQHGNTVSLFERDCSIQRRHQKVLEEAPAPGLDTAQREAMGAAAVAAARAVNYVGAGTVEFIHENGAFYFMEMNTRLQVEHPVTEMVTGLDLVEWQLRVASGEPLPISESNLSLRGHAIEARVYAEDPAREFLPAVGTLLHLRQPTEKPGRVRVDTGVVQGSTITSYYDPMIAKLVVWGENREAAVRQLARALDEYEVVGVTTNLDLLRSIAAHPLYVAGDIDTGFIARNVKMLLPSMNSDAALPNCEPYVLAAAVLALLRARFREIELLTASTGDPWSPWAGHDGWRMNAAGKCEIRLALKSEAVSIISAQPLSDGRFSLEWPGSSTHLARLSEAEHGTLIVFDGVSRPVRIVHSGAETIVIVSGRNYVFVQEDPLAPAHTRASRADRVTAPVPGRVVRIMAAPGDRVQKDEALLVVEAMKMEMTLRAPKEGIIAEVRCSVADLVEEGAELVTFAVAQT